MCHKMQYTSHKQLMTGTKQTNYTLCQTVKTLGCESLQRYAARCEHLDNNVIKYTLNDNCTNRKQNRPIKMILLFHSL